MVYVYLYGCLRNKYAQRKPRVATVHSDSAKGPGPSNRPDSDEAHQYHHYALAQHGNETGVGPSWAESARHQLAPSGERPTRQRINHTRTPGISNGQ